MVIFTVVSYTVCLTASWRLPQSVSFASALHLGSLNWFSCTFELIALLLLLLENHWSYLPSAKVFSLPQYILSHNDNTESRAFYSFTYLTLIISNVCKRKIMHYYLTFMRIDCSMDLFTMYSKIKIFSVNLWSSTHIPYVYVWVSPHAVSHAISSY